MDPIASLRIFARMIELGGFPKAADDLGHSQSTVTKDVARLRDRSMSGLRSGADYDRATSS